MNKEKITPYPKKVNVSDIQNIRVWADHWKHAHINVKLQMMEKYFD